jgi:hypothetical protein
MDLCRSLSPHIDYLGALTSERLEETLGVRTDTLEVPASEACNRGAPELRHDEVARDVRSGLGEESHDTGVTKRTSYDYDQLPGKQVSNGSPQAGARLVK